MLPQHPVIRPEIVSPLRNAMRLVNRDQRQPLLGQHLRKPRHPQPLRSNKKKLQLTAQVIHASLPRHRPIQPRVNPRHLQPQRPQLRRLVFHQRNQRRNHQRRPAPCNRRQLVAQALPRPRRHHQQQVSPLDRRAAHRLLACPEPGKPKHRPQQLLQIFGFPVLTQLHPIPSAKSPRASLLPTLQDRFIAPSPQKSPVLEHRAVAQIRQLANLRFPRSGSQPAVLFEESSQT